MNGRVYDPVLARFLSPDNFIQAPNNTQSFNRYSYVLNNPLKYTDPSGWEWTETTLELLNDKGGQWSDMASSQRESGNYYEKDVSGNPEIDITDISNNANQMKNFSELMKDLFGDKLSFTIVNSRLTINLSKGAILNKAQEEICNTLDNMINSSNIYPIRINSNNSDDIFSTGLYSNSEIYPLNLRSLGKTIPKFMPVFFWHEIFEIKSKNENYKKTNLFVLNDDKYKFDHDYTMNAQEKIFGLTWKGETGDESLKKGDRVSFFQEGKLFETFIGFKKNVGTSAQPFFKYSYKRMSH